MATYGLLIDYEYCTNCGSCIVSCKEEHDYPLAQSGITILKDGPWKIDDDNWNFNYYPVLTDLCDLCAGRTAIGREPFCVHHCLANILKYGEVSELEKELERKPKQMLIVPQFMPRVARGKFVPRGNKDLHHAAHMNVDGTGDATFGAHRADSKVGEFETNQ